MPDAVREESALQRLGAWVAGLDGAALPEAVRHAARRSIVDTMGVALGGLDRPAAVTARRHALGHYAAGPSGLLGGDGDDNGGGLVPAGAAFANAVAAHALDFDDTCYVGIAHGSAVVLPAVLAAGQAAAGSGLALLTAFAAGVEAEYTLGRLFGDRLYFKGFWNTGTLGTLGAAAGTARILGLSAGETAHALAIAATQVIGLRACLGSMAKPILAGRAAETGVAAAFLARLGVDGPLAVLEGDNGWAKVLNDGHIDLAALDRLGAPFVLAEPGVAFKLYPVCSAAQAAVETVLALMAEHGLAGGDVAQVRCEVTPLVHISLRYPRPRTPAEGQFSMPFAVGCALAYGGLEPAMLTAERLADPALAAAMARVEMVLAEDLAGDPQVMAQCPEGARVILTTGDGRCFTRFHGLATGMPGNPLSDAGLAGKFRRCAAPVIGADAAGDLLERLWRLEEVTDLAVLLPAKKSLL